MRRPSPSTLLIVVIGVVVVSGIAAEPTRFTETVRSIPVVVANAIPRMAVSMAIVLGFAEVTARILTGKSLRMHRSDNDPRLEYLLIPALVVASALALIAI